MVSQHDLLIVEKLFHFGNQLDNLPQLREAVLARLERLVVHRAELLRELGHGDRRVASERVDNLFAQQSRHLVGYGVNCMLRVALNEHMRKRNALKMCVCV